MYKGHNLDEIYAFYGNRVMINCYPFNNTNIFNPFPQPAPATNNSSTISSPPGAAFVFGQPTGSTGGFGAPQAPAGSGYNFGGSTPAPSFNFGAGGGGGAGPIASSQPAGGAFQFRLDFNYRLCLIMLSII